MEIMHKIKLKKLKLDIDTEKKYNQTYDLNNMIREDIPWEYGECMILDKEKLLFSLYYHYVGDVAEREDGHEWHGLNRFIFHIVENEEDVIIKYLNLRKVEEKAFEISGNKIKNLGMYQRVQQGIIQQEYKDYIRNEKMKSIRIDKSKFEKEIAKLSKIDYKDLEFFSCKLAYESIDYFDYVNKVAFYCDRYYPKKYEKCIGFVNYILKECNILNMEKVNLQPFTKEEKEKIMIKLIKEKIQQDGGYFA